MNSVRRAALLPILLPILLAGCAITKVSMTKDENGLVAASAEAWRLGAQSSTSGNFRTGDFSSSSSPDEASTAARERFLQELLQGALGFRGLPAPAAPAPSTVLPPYQPPVVQPQSQPQPAPIIPPFDPEDEATDPSFREGRWEMLQAPEPPAVVEIGYRRHVVAPLQAAPKPRWSALRQRLEEIKLHMPSV